MEKEFTKMDKKQELEGLKTHSIMPSKELTNFILAETNLEKLPYFAPNKKKRFGKDGLTYKYTKEILRNGKAVRLEWKVAAHPEFGGFPNHFDRDIYRCIQKLITEKGLTNDGWVSFSIYEIAEILGKKACGKVYKDIKNSFYKMLTTTIQSKGAFFYKGKKTWIKETFHLFDLFVEKGKDLPDGSIAETNYLKVGDWLLKSIKSSYLKPVDFDYYISLSKPNSKALYSKLSVDFYGLPDNVKFLKKRYSCLCAETLITPQKYISDIKRTLSKGLIELIRTGFLSKVEFEPIPGYKKDFYIKFYPGKRAKEPNKFKTIYPNKVEVFNPNQDLLTTINSKNDCIIDIIDDLKEDLSDEDKLILKNLLDLHVSKATAIECIKNHKAKTNYWLKAKDYDNTYKNADNKAGFLIKAIKSNWSSQNYEEYLNKIKLNKQKEALEEEERRKNQLKELEKQKEQELLDSFYNSLPQKDQIKIETQIQERLKKENLPLHQYFKKSGLTVGVENILKQYRYEELRILTAN